MTIFTDHPDWQLARGFVADESTPSIRARRLERGPGRRSTWLGPACATLFLACGDGPVASVISMPPTTGSIVVLAVIEGNDLDADGFLVYLDGAQPQTISSGQRVVFKNVTPGAHAVQVEGIAENCILQESNPQRMVVVVREVRTIAFNVFCLTRGTGAVRVHVSRGFERFSITIDDAVFSSSDGALLVTDLQPGHYSLQLHADPGECTINGENPRTISVEEGHIDQFAFLFYCELTVKVTTTGTSQPAGYVAYLEQDIDYYCEGSCFGRFVDANGTIVFALPPVWGHRITLRSVPDNCTVTPSEHRVAIPARERARIAFAVSCR